MAGLRRPKQPVVALRGFLLSWLIAFCLSFALLASPASATGDRFTTKDEPIEDPLDEEDPFTGGTGAGSWPGRPESADVLERRFSFVVTSPRLVTVWAQGDAESRVELLDQGGTLVATAGGTPLRSFRLARILGPGRYVLVVVSHGRSSYRIETAAVPWLESSP